MKLAVISHVLPPSWSGQAIMLSRLLGDLGAEEYCLISRQHFEEGNDADSFTRRLAGRYHRLPPEPQLNRGYRYGLAYLREALNAPPGIIARARRVARIVRREGSTAVVACTGDLHDLPAGYLASRMTGVPFYPYVFDYYSEQFIDPEKRLLARLLEPRLMRGAARVIVPNETLRDELRRRYQVEPAVVHNPCDLKPYEGLPASPPARADGEVRITYTGAVYDAHFDAFRNLLAAIESLGRADVRLHLHTAQSPEALARRGIRGPVVFHGHRHVSEMPRVQSESDILFLPLAFESPYPELVRTSAAGKMAEYMAARRPVLVHAPPRSFVSWYFRRHECGEVVDVNDPAPLARAVERLATDRGHGARLVARAWERARADFSVEQARAAFFSVFGEGARAAVRGESAGGPPVVVL